MIRPAPRSPALLVLLAGLAGGTLAPAAAARARMASPPQGGLSSCAAHVPAPAVCDQTLGMALTVPTGWSVIPREKFPPGYLAFWTLTPGTQEPPAQLVVEPVGLASACSDRQAALAVAEALARTAPGALIARQSGTVAGAPAVYLYDLPATPVPSVQIIMAHHGAVYQLIFPGSARNLRPDQRHALASLRFIPRRGSFPHRPDDAFLTTVLRQCARMPTAQSTVRTIIGSSPLTANVPAFRGQGQLAFVAAGRLYLLDGDRGATALRSWVNSRTLWVAHADGTGAHAVPAAGGGIYRPQWSRDGRHVLVVRENALWLIDVRGGAPVRILGPVPRHTGSLWLLWPRAVADRLGLESLARISHVRSIGGLMAETCAG